MTKLLLVDMDKCTGCKQCSLACSLTKEELFDPHRSRIKIMKREEIALGIQLLCEQCEAHPCIDSCPEKALERDKKTGIISVYKDSCTGCGKCVDACPYHGIGLHPEQKYPLICDLCGGNPYCVPHCVPNALRWVDQTDATTKEKKKLRTARMSMYREITKEAV
jgi:Fe-S-cluster-containing hydrogenase component 2